MAISGGDGSIVLTTKVDESGLSSGLSKLKSGVGAFGKAFAVAGAAGVAAFAGITKAAVDSYAEFEQLSGGVQKIFNEIDYSKIAEDAGNAYKTMGMSANEYLGVMTTVGANFASTLGDAKGYEVAKQGMQAISDFASGTGRSVDELSEKYQMITKSTSSYQSIADQFAGILPATSADFLEQAQAAGFLSDSYTKLTDVPMAEYQEAVTQMLSKGVDALGLTGNTAMEASTTLSGSMAMMQASWQNLLTGFADPTQNIGNLLQNFVSSVQTFGTNLIPVITTASQSIIAVLPSMVESIVSLINELLPVVIEGATALISGIVDVLPQIVDAIVGLLPQLLTATTNLITQIATALPALMQVIVSALPTIIQSIVVALPTMIPALINGIVQAIVILVAALPQIIQPIIDNLPMIITAITGALIGNLPILIQGAIQLVVALVAALPQIIMALLKAMGGIAVQIGNALFKALPGPVQNAFKAAFDAIKAVWNLVQPYFAIIWEGIKAVFSVVGAVLGGFFSTAWAMIKAVWDTVTGYYSAIWDTIAGIFSVVASVLSGNWSDAWEAIKGIVKTWANFFRGVWESIKSVFSAVGSWFKGIFSAAWNGIKNVWSAVGSFFSGIINTIKSIFQQLPSKLIAIGKNMVNGLWNGIQNAKNWLLGKIKQWCGSILNGIKSFFGIHSPSTVMRDEVGKQIPAGMAIGIDKAKNLVTKATKALVTDTRSEVQKVLDDMNEEMLDSEKLYAEESIRLKDSTVEADKEYLDNLKKTAETERKLYDARQKDIENLKKNIVDAYSEMANEALSSIEDLENQQQSLEQKLAEYGGLMVEKTKKVRGKEVKYNVLADLDEQKETLQSYYDMLQTVKERGNVPKEFFNVLREMGVDEGLEYANALLELSDEDFAEYIKDWEEKQKLSQDISKALYEEEAQQLADEIGNKFDEVEKEFFGVGENSADEFEDGFMEQLQTVIKNIKRTINGAFSGITPDANYGIGGYSINVPALARGSVLPGGKPFLAIVNDQPRGQTNVEAPLQTIVDAMNIALNNRGGSEIIREEHYNLNETELMTILHKLVKGGERLQGKSLISGGAY